jgi:hypothetical protein
MRYLIILGTQTSFDFKIWLLGRGGGGREGEGGGGSKGKGANFPSPGSFDRRQPPMKRAFEEEKKWTETFHQPFSSNQLYLFLSSLLTYIYYVPINAYDLDFYNIPVSHFTSCFPGLHLCLARSLVCIMLIL